MLAIIGGSGLTKLSTLAVAHREIVRTPYGEPSAPLLFGQIAGQDVVFLARHGHGHTIPPHRVNYRANLSALQGARRRMRSSPSPRSAASAGTAPGDLVLPHQLHRLHVRSPAHVLRRRRPQGRARRLHASVHAGVARDLPRGGRARRASRSPTAASTPRCRARAWRPRPRSTAWSATARRWSA